MSNLDEALERFHLADLEYAGGRANHGPMAAEALESLGHQALIPALVDLYAPRLPPAETGRVRTAEALGGARGRPDRRADWVATFEARLEREDWRALVGRIVPDLLPGLFASAGHGLLRTAHAVRALEREDSPLRRRELARALASWAAREQALPGRPGARARTTATTLATAATAEWSRDLEAFFEALPRAGEGTARDELFFEAARRLDPDGDFCEAIEGAPTPGDDTDVEAWLVELARVGAALYLAHPEARVAYVHAVTLPVALRGLVPLLGEEPARAGAGYVLQAVAALHALFGERGERGDRGERGERGVPRVAAGVGEPGELGVPRVAAGVGEPGERGVPRVAAGVGEPGERGVPRVAAGVGEPGELGVGETTGADELPAAESWDEIRYRAACSIQEHAIKLTEACWRMHAMTPDRVFRLAAADAALQLEGSRRADGC